MHWQDIFFKAYILLPLFFVVLSLFRQANIYKFISMGALLCLLRILLLLPLLWISQHEVKSIETGYSMIKSLRLTMDFSLDTAIARQLLVLDFSFLLAFFTNSYSGLFKRFMEPITCAVLGLISVQLLAQSLILSSATQMLVAILFFVLIRFSLENDRPQESIYISRRVIFLYTGIAILVCLWSVGEFAKFGQIESVHLHLEGSATGASILKKVWLLGLLFVVPIAPFAAWFNRALEKIPEGITIPLIGFVCVSALQFIEAFDAKYIDLKWKYKFLIYVAGLIGCLFCLSGLFAAKSKRTMMAFLPKFYFSLILVSLGVSEGASAPSTNLILLFIPIFTGLILYASVLDLKSLPQKIFLGVFILLIFGVPGSPVYQIFASIGTRSIDMGASYLLAFAAVWFLYFCANVHIIRRMFIDEQTSEMGVDSILSRAPLHLTVYAIFLVLSISVLALSVIWEAQ